MQLKDSGRILDKLIQVFKDNAHLIMKGKTDVFFTTAEKLFEIDLSEIKEHVANNIQAMGEMNSDLDQQIMMLYMTLAKMLEHMRESIYKTYVLDVIRTNYERESGKKFSDEGRKKMTRLSEVGDDDLSLLYNLSFVRLLAEKFNDKPVETNLKRQMTMRINSFVKKMIQG